jgi:hypothetical protein
MTTTKDNTGTDLAILPPRAVALIEELDIKLADPNEIQWRIAEQTALATSVDDLLADRTPLGLREHMGEAFYVRHVEYMPSALGGSGLYAVIHAVTPDGEAVIYTSGATSVVIALAKGMKEGWFDGVLLKAAWSADQPNADGNRPYRLVKA